MFETISAPDHVLALRLAGRVVTEDIGAYRVLLATKLAGERRLAACIDLSQLSDVDADALSHGLAADAELLRHVRRFHRIAIVTDKHWPDLVVQATHRIFPSLAMRRFAAAQAAEAMRWASADEVSTREVAEPAALRVVATTDDGVLAFEIDGMITRESIAASVGEIDSFVQRHPRLRLLVRLRRFAGVEPQALADRRLWSMKLAAMRRLDRYAIVGGPEWIAGLAQAVDGLLEDIAIRRFEADDEAQAWAWLCDAPAQGTSVIAHPARDRRRSRAASP